MDDLLCRNTKVLSACLRSFLLESDCHLYHLTYDKNIAGIKVDGLDAYSANACNSHGCMHTYGQFVGILNGKPNFFSIQNSLDHVFQAKSQHDCEVYFLLRVVFSAIACGSEVTFDISHTHIEDRLRAVRLNQEASEQEKLDIVKSVLMDVGFIAVCGIIKPTIIEYIRIDKTGYPSNQSEIDALIAGWSWKSLPDEVVGQLTFASRCV